MNKDKILITINNLKEIEEYKKIGISNFLFSIESFSIDHFLFKLDDIKDINANIYLNINKTMDTKTIDEFKQIINDLSFIKGIFFDDIGVYQVLKDSNIPLIWNQSHFVLNSKSINFWLEKVNSACLSNELTKEEIEYILKEANKPLILSVFGSNNAMQSRRHLISAFNTAKDVKIPLNATLVADNGDKFTAKEDNDGMSIYYHDFFNYVPIINELDDSKILLYLIDTFKLEIEDVLGLISGKYPESDEKFLNNKTIYKLEEK